MWSGQCWVRCCRPRRRIGGTSGLGTLAACGYVDQGNLRKDPDLNVAIIVTIHEQWVDINC